MKKMLIAANWKSNKTKIEAKTWLDEVSKVSLPQSLEVVIFPPFTLLDFVSNYTRENDLPFKVGTQDISPFEQGPFTGEVNANQIKEFADYVLIGHSERRTNFGESNETINKKIERSLAGNLIPIVCVSNLDQINSLGSQELIIAYEPISAIRTGSPEDPSEVNSIANQIKSAAASRVIYGGSVNGENVRDYLNLNNISGVLVGGESLNPSSFNNILKNAF